MVEHLGSIQIVVKCLNVLYIYDRLILGWYTGGPEGVLEQAGGSEQHNSIEAAPNELKLGEGG